MDKSSKYTLVIQTKKWNPDFSSVSNLHIVEANEGDGAGCNKTTIFTIAGSHYSKNKIRIDWHNGGLNEIIHTLLVPETDRLFYGTRINWGVIDLVYYRLEKHDHCVDFWNFERHDNSIIVITELYAESLTLTGQIIDRVPIDPPFESKNFEDRIEFNSPTYGQQILTIHKRQLT